MSQFSQFILENANSINHEDLANIIYNVKILHINNDSVLKKVDDLCRQFLTNEILNLPGKFNFSRALSTAKDAIIHLKLSGEEFENERLELSKLIFPQKFGKEMIEELSEIFKLMELNDNSKLELFKIALTRVSNRADLDYLLQTLECFVIDPKYYVEGLKSLAHHIDKNPKLFSEEDKLANICHTEQALKIFEADPEFFIQLYHKFKNSKLFEKTIKSLKNTYLEYFCEKIPSHVFKVINTWNIESLEGLDKRLSLAESCFNQDPQVFAEYLLNVFTEEEVRAYPEFFNPKIGHCLASIPEDDARYLMKVNQYLGRYSEQRTYEQDCHHWDCIGEFPPGSGILTFKLKWTYHEESKARAIKYLTHTTKSDNDLIFPAVEPNLDFLSPDIFKRNQVLSRLGFEYQIGPSGAFLSLPGIDTLMEKWDQLRLEPGHQNLPPLALVTIDGIASTSTYIDLLEHHFVVVSKNKEFIHDMIFHVATTIGAIYSSSLNGTDRNKFSDSMNRMRDIGRKTMAGIERAREIYTNPKEVATLNIISESMGVLYDAVTSGIALWFRKNRLDEFENGIFFLEVFGPSVGNKDPSANYVKYFWSIDAIRSDMITLGVPSDTAPEDLHNVFPYQKLQEMWKKIYLVEG